MIMIVEKIKQDHQELKVLKDLKVKLDHKDHQVKLGKQELQGHRVQKVIQELQAHKDQKVIQELQAHKVQKVIQDHKDQLDQ